MFFINATSKPTRIPCFRTRLSDWRKYWHVALMLVRAHLRTYWLFEKRLCYVTWPGSENILIKRKCKLSFNVLCFKLCGTKYKWRERKNHEISISAMAVKKRLCDKYINYTEVFNEKNEFFFFFHIFEIYRHVLVKCEALVFGLGHSVLY